MSEHSLDELKRQYKEAENRAMEAHIKKLEAGERYTAKAIEEKLAEFAERGITPGTKVRIGINQWHGGKQYQEAGFLGVEAGYSPGRVETIFSHLKKDGTPGKARRIMPYYNDIEAVPVDGDAG